MSNVPTTGKFAIVLRIMNMPVLGTFIANIGRPYVVPPGMENHAHNSLQRRGHMVIVADKETLLANPFDLCSEDFNEPMSLPNPIHHDGAASAPSVDGVVRSLN